MKRLKVWHVHALWIVLLLALLLVGCADNPKRPAWLKGQKHFYLPWN